MSRRWCWATGTYLWLEICSRNYSSTLPSPLSLMYFCMLVHVAAADFLGLGNTNQSKYFKNKHTALETSIRWAFYRRRFLFFSPLAIIPNILAVQQCSPPQQSAPRLRLHCLLCGKGEECGAEEEHSSHRPLSDRITLMLSVAFFFFAAAISIPVGLICCLEMFFAWMSILLVENDCALELCLSTFHHIM